MTFDGTNDFLQTSTQVLTGTETGANSMYAVIKQTSGDGGYICGSAGTGGSGARVGQSLYSSDIDKVILTDGQDASTGGTLDSITRIEGSNYLISVNYSNNNTDTLHSNSNANGYSNGSSAYAFSAGTKFTIGARDGSTAEAVLFDGSMKEIIAYDSDQSDNRFKIESNINNYYGLYNDANNLAGNFTVDSSGTGTNASISNESKTGFTATVVDKAGFFGADLNEAIPNGSNLYISFNANLSPSGGTAATPNFGLADSSDKTGNSTGNPLDTAVVEGFNSITVAGTASTCDRIRFTEGNDNVSFIISDFKVSRIARNGFVETWYDQSGNGNNASQTTAGNQPAIVQNGSITTSNGSPSVFFTGDTRDDELDFTDLTLTDATIFTVVNIDSSADQQIIIGGSALTSTGTMIPIMDNGSSTTEVYKNSTVGGAEQGSSQFKNGAQITLADRDDAFDNLAVDSQILFTMVDVDVAEAKVLDGISRTPQDASAFHLQGKMNELIIYNSDLSSDRGTIESEIANHYNITLS